MLQRRHAESTQLPQVQVSLSSFHAGHLKDFTAHYPSCQVPFRLRRTILRFTSSADDPAMRAEDLRQKGAEANEGEDRRCSSRYQTSHLRLPHCRKHFRGLPRKRRQQRLRLNPTFALSHPLSGTCLHSRILGGGEGARFVCPRLLARNSRVQGAHG